MNIKKELVKIIVIIICTSCHRAGNESMAAQITDTILFSRPTKETIGSAVDSISYLALETNENSILANVDKMIIRDGRIYIGDYGRARLLVFDMEGNYLFNLNKRGRGPGEYLALNAYTVDDNYLYLLDNDSGKLRKYDHSQKFIEQFDAPVLAWDVGVFDNGDLMLATAPLDPRGFKSGQSRHRIFITDEKLNIHTSLLKYSNKDVDPVGKRNYLVENEYDIVFHWVGSDVISIFSKADPQSIEHIFVDFGANKILPKYRPDLHRIDEIGYNYILDTPVISDRYVSLDVSLGEYNETFLYDRIIGQLFDQKDVDPILFPYPNGYSDGKYYTLLNSIMQYHALVDGGFPEADELVESHLKRDGTTMIVYHMKK